MYEYYVKETGLLKLGEEEMDMSKRYTYLLRFLTRMNGNFRNIFRNTVSRTPGMRIYLLTNVVFDKNDNMSRDWLTRFMIDFLTPTEEDHRELEALCRLPEDISEKFAMLNVERIPSFFDETYTLIGMWRRDVNDWITEPINTIDTKNLPTKFVKKIDVAKIIEEAGIIDCSRIEPPGDQEDPMSELPF